MTGRAATSEAPGTGADAQPRPAEPRSRKVDPVSLVAGLIFIAIALAALTDRHWADIDAVLVFGGAIVAAGVALMVSVILRRRREQHGTDPTA